MQFLGKAKCIWQSVKTPGVWVPGVIGTWEPRASSPSSRACSSSWKSVFSFAPPAPSALRALPLTVTPHRMSWKKQKKYWERQNKGHKIEKLAGVWGKVLLGVGTVPLAPGDPTLMWAQHLTVPWLGVMPAQPLCTQGKAASSQDNEEAIAPHNNSPNFVLWTMLQLQKHCLGLQLALEKCFSHRQKEMEDMGRSRGLGQARFGRRRDLKTWEIHFILNVSIQQPKQCAQVWVAQDVLFKSAFLPPAVGARTPLHAWIWSWLRNDNDRRPWKQFGCVAFYTIVFHCCISFGRAVTYSQSIGFAVLTHTPLACWYRCQSDTKHRTQGLFNYLFFLSVFCLFSPSFPFLFVFLSLFSDSFCSLVGAFLPLSLCRLPSSPAFFPSLFFLW